MKSHDVVDAIVRGDLDGSFDEITRAIVDRVRAGAVAFHWRIRFNGDEWTRDSATLAEVFEAQRRADLIAADRSLRRELNPAAYEGDLLALVIAHLVKTGGMTLDEAVARVEKVTRDDIEVTEYEVVRPPKGAAISPPPPSS